ncbi:unnamed protein product [Calypogeia fissa]
MDVSPEELPLLYSWIDGIPLSRPKRNICRDFSDAVLVAEVVAHYCPKLVDVHNYSAANSLAQKVYNWNTLNVKVFRRLHFSLTKEDIEAVASGEPQRIERILKLLKYKMAKYKPSGLNGDVFTSHKSDEPFSSSNKARTGASSLIRLAQQSQIKDEGFRPGYMRETEGRESRARHGTPSKTQVSQEHYVPQRAPSPRRSQDISIEKLQEKEAHIRELGETIEIEIEAGLAFYLRLIVSNVTQTSFSYLLALIAIESQ